MHARTAPAVADVALSEVPGVPGAHANAIARGRRHEVAAPGCRRQPGSNRGGAAVALTVSTAWMGLPGWRAALQSSSAVPEAMVQLGPQCAGAGAFLGAT